MPHRTAPSRWVATALATVALLVLPFAPGARADSSSPQDSARPPVVLVGMAGLRWDDVDQRATPHLWALAGRAALGSVTVRATLPWTCAADGWLTVGAGRRSRLPRPPRLPAGYLPEGVRWARCPVLPTPRTTSATTAGTPAQAAVPGWSAVFGERAQRDYDSHPGLLGDTLAGTRGPIGSGRSCATAVGPGAALALARTTGVVARYLPSPASLSPAVVSACAVTVVDLGAVSEPGFDSVTVDVAATPQAAATAQRLAAKAGYRVDAALPPRARQVALLERRLAELQARLPAHSTMLLVTVADSTAQAHLGVAAAIGAAVTRGRTGWLDTRSTRRSGLVQLTDVLPAALTAAGVPVPRTAIGSPWTSSAHRPGTTEAVHDLASRDTASVVTGRLLSPFTIFLVVSQLLLYSAAAIALRGPWSQGSARVRLLATTRATALVFAAMPIASYLVNLLPWWRHAHPLAGLLGLLAVTAVLVAALALAGPWRAHLLGPPTAVAVVTALVLALDVVNGSPLQLNAVLGYSPLIAGRFFGFGNIAYALFAASTILATAGLAAPLVERGRRRAVGALAAVAGLVAVLLDGADRFGTDFGGVIGLVPGFAVLGMGLVGARVTVRRLVLSLGGGVAAISVLATLDWLQPPARRTHLGLFVQQVIDGQGVGVVQRKLHANLQLLLHTPYGIIVPAALAFLVFVLMRPLQARASALQLAYGWAPTLRPGLFGALTALVVGFAVNDSGIVIPAVGLAVVVPLALAASVTALQRADDDDLRALTATPAAPTPGPPAPGPARTTA